MSRDKDHKEEKRTILIQEYEHFDSMDDESLTYTFERFMNSLNDLSLVGKKYTNLGYLKCIKNILLY